MLVVRAGALVLLLIAGIVAGGSPGPLQGARLPAGVAVAPPATATPMVATGGGHTCALNGNGAVRCWGRNADGELGDGTTISHQRPALVAGLSSGVTAIAAGFAHTCALTTAGGVKCWGNNADGELGDFTQVSRTTPVDVINLTTGVVAISAGDRHTCALLATGGMMCWGYNVYGEVGNGTSGNLWLGAVDVCASGSGVGCAGGAPLTGIASMSAGGINTCAVTTAGALKCWGGNYSGQLGLGILSDSPLPPGGVCPTSPDPNATCISLPADVPSLQSGVADVNAGQTACALTTAGGVLCWGLNNVGETGSGIVSPCNPKVPPQPFVFCDRPQPDPAGVSGLSAGAAAISDGCALLMTGGMKCWGDNVFGQVGDGTTTVRTTPVGVSGLGSGVASIGPGQDAVHHCVTMAAGSLKCWGSNSWGQLGAASADTCFSGWPCSLVPVAVQQCTICVEGITFEHQVYPDEVNWTPVGAQGTIDGNQVRVKATLRDQTGTDQPVTVEIRDVDTGTLLPGGSIDGTVPASGALPVTYVWNTDGFAWDGGAARSLRHVRVTVLQGSTTADTDLGSIKIIPKPVVLVHGWASNFATWSAYQGFLSAVHPDWKAFAVGDGQAPGVMNTGSWSHPFTLTNTIYQNAIEMSHYVQGVRQKMNAWHVDVVAHSMGGLISRDYIQYWMPPDAYGAPVIDHLVMLGTPNQGTSCADLGAVVLGPLGSGAFLFPATLQLTKTYLAVFNTQVTNRRGVKFSISAGDPIPITCLEGAGDEIVPYRSALMLDPLPGTPITDAESRLILHHHMAGDPDQFTQFVKPRLTGIVPAAADAAAAGVRAPARAVAAVAPPAVLAPQILAGVGVEVAASGTADVPFTVTDGTRIGVTLLAAPSVTTELRNPLATVVASVAAGSDAAQAGLRTMTFDAPAAGVWTLHLVNTDSAAPADVAGSAWVDGSAVQLVLAPPAPNPDGSVRLSAALTSGGGAAVGATITATLTGADGPHGPLTLLDDGLHDDGAAADGTYGGTTAALAPGLYSIAVRATAPAVERYTAGAVEVASVAATPTSTASATATSTQTASATDTATATPTAVPTATDTPAATNTATATATATATPSLTYNVNSTADVADAHPGDGICATGAGACTLRAAVMEAFTHFDPTRINLPAGTYRLTIGPPEGLGEYPAPSHGDLDLSRTTTVVGAGASTTIIDGNGIDRVFESAGVNTIRDVTIRGGDAHLSDGSQTVGDGLWVSGGSLALERVVVTANAAGDAAIAVNGALTISDSAIEGNAGAGIRVGNGSLSLLRSAVKDNAGGGIRTENQYGFGTADVTDSTISGNRLGGDGAGVWNGGALTLLRSTVSANTAGGRGGGIANFATATITDSTISSNAAEVDGGGIFNDFPRAAHLTLTNVTVAHNLADSDQTGSGDGGGIYNGGIGNVTLTNTLLAANTDAGGEAPDCGGTAASGGHNLLQSTAGCALSPAAGDRIGVAAAIGPLADNGGPTFTHALLAGSPAIDAGLAAACGATDQRGRVRPVDGDGDGTPVCDIGAVELDPADGPPASLAPAPPVAAPLVTFTVDSFADGVDAAPGNGVCATAGGVCTLRAAVMEANALPGTNVIRLGAGTYQLSIPTLEVYAPDASRGDLDVSEGLVIEGAGAAQTAIDAGGLDGGITSRAVLELKGLTVRNGAPSHTPGGASVGGGGVGALVLLLQDVDVTGNQGTAVGGGWIAARGVRVTSNSFAPAVSTGYGSLYLADTTVSNTTFGGGITTSVPALVVRSTITGNTRSGMTIQDASADIIDTTISGNHADTSGGGVEIGYGDVRISGTTVDGNTSTGSGGGIDNNGTLLLANSTISGNSASQWGGGLINNNLGTTTLRNVTITANTAQTGGSAYGDGGGIYQASSRAIFVENTIIAGNADTGGQAPDCAGTLPSPSYNLIGDLSGCTIVGTSTGNIIGQAARLGPLRDNGGLTRTHALLAGSPAIDQGGDALCERTDQRGVRRPIDGDGDGHAACDIGAFEAPAGSPAATATPTASATEPATPTPTSTAMSMPTPVATSTSTPTASATGTATATDTPVPTTTAAPTVTTTPTAVHTGTATATTIATSTSTPSATATSTSQATATSTSTSTASATPTPTGSTAAPILSIATATSSPVASPTPSAGTPQATATLVSSALAATAQRGGTAPLAGLPNTGAESPEAAPGAGRGLTAAGVLALVALAVCVGTWRRSRRRRR